jgi:hypothetical protein
VVDQLAVEYNNQPVVFIDHDVDDDSISGRRLSVWFGAWGTGKTAYLPLIMLGSGFQVRSGSVDFYSVYRSMIEAELARPPKASIDGYCRREGNRIRFSGRLTNHSGVPLSTAGNSAALTGIVAEENLSAARHRWVRMTASLSVAETVAPDATSFFSFTTAELTGVDWSALHPLLVADYKPGGNVPAYDMLQGARAGWLAVSDLNGDGKTDLIWQNPFTQDVRSWLMEGLQVNSMVNLPPSPGRNWQFAGAEDFNLDGSMDLIWHNLRSGENRVWLMDHETFTSEAGLEPLPDPQWRIAAVSDFDRDGFPDLLWRNYSTGANQIWYMTGLSKRQSVPLPAFSDTNWILAGVGDLVGTDGKPDLVWRHSLTGENRVWIMNGTAQAGSLNIEAWDDPAWNIALVADFDGDGKTDLFWHNCQTGDNFVWLMDGTRKRSVIALDPMADRSFQIGNYPFPPPDNREKFQPHTSNWPGPAGRGQIRD